MRRSTVVVTTLALGIMGAGGWLVFGPRSEPIPVPESVLAPPPPSSQPVRPNLAIDLGEFRPPSDPAPPAIGTPARRVYFEAMIAGDQRALAAVRKALSVAKSGHGPADEVHLRKLAAMERTYVERLGRHGQELGKK